MSACSLLATGLLFSIPLAGLAQTPMHIRIDLTDASRRIIHVTEQIPVHPGANTFSYPEWIPSQELPGGPIDNLTGLVFRSGAAGAHPVPWRRDLSDAYKFHVVVPEDVSLLVVSYDILDVPSRRNTIGTNHTSAHVVMVEPSEVVLYPGDRSLEDTPIATEIRLPEGWKAATALRTGGSAAPSLQGPSATFQTVSIEQLIDSPILAGDHCRQYPLAPAIHPVHTLSVCSDRDADLDLQPALLARMNALVEQATKLFVGHHYEHYDFLVGASPHLQGDSAEHTQSADYIVSSLDISDLENAGVLGSLLPHEFVHSWCGKYRRPAGEATADDNTPMQNDLIWVYEGLAQYYGNVLSARAGFRTPEQIIGALDYEAFQLDKPGRQWRSVQDTADASAILRGNDTAWANWRLSQDYYYAGTLLWLEADAKIRELTRGQKSLDDFAALFLAPPVAGSSSRDTGPGVLPYRLADLFETLQAVAPYDWQGFWYERLNALDMRSLTRGLEASGYSYVYQDTMIPAEAAFVKASHVAEMYHSLGLQASADGTLIDVWIGSPAYTAGLGPGDRLTRINGKPYSPEELTRVVHASETNRDLIVVEAVRDDETHVYKIAYHGGEKYAALVRNAKPDLLTANILLPR